MDASVTLSLDGIRFRLRKDHDLRFLKQLGQVFCVFDGQDSGNICFGVRAGGEKLFAKYAGARTLNFDGDPADAVRLLREAMPVYRALQHPTLVTLREHYAVGDGYLAIFDWFEGECLYAHRALTPEEKAHHPDSPFRRHRCLPQSRRLDTLDAIFAFHEHAAQRGYVAIDFYDGCLLYDFAQHTTRICDIDCYRPLPQTNTMGRMWGSTRFMSPEEFALGAALDEVTNVFTMGAAAFVLLGGNRDRSPEAWEASPALYQVARTAANPDRSLRYPSITTFRQAWEQAKG